MTQPAPARPRSIVPWAAGVLVVLLAAALGWFFLFRGDGGPTVVTTTGGGLNKPVRDGAFAFTVTALRCGAAVSDEIVEIEPKGSFCLVDVVVTNAGTSAAFFDSNAQKAYDAKGAEFSTDPQAEVLVNTDAQNFLDQINPGAQVRGTLVYDVPDDTTLASVVLHESFSSPGARIALK